MFPRLKLDKVIEEVEQEENKVYDKTFLFDFDKGDFVVRDGRLVEVAGKEATKVRLEKLLRTEKFKYEIYKTLDNDNEDEYGTNIKKLIYGKKLPLFFVESELKREIEENIKKYIQEIDRIENFRVEHELSTLKIFFTVILRNNDTFTQEVSF